MHKSCKKIKKKNEYYVKHANKEKKKVIFFSLGSFWERIDFQLKEKIKIKPRGGDSFHVPQTINNKTYILDLPNDYVVSHSSKVGDLSPFWYIYTWFKDESFSKWGGGGLGCWDHGYKSTNTRE